jgi:transposase InsO family protein
VRAELLAMSAATIDRYLADARRAGQLRGIAATRPSPLLRTSIAIRKAGDEVEAEPGFFECDTVAHCGTTLVGEFARSVNFTDVLTGWVFTRSIRNNAHVHIRRVMDASVAEIPYSVVGLDFDNGSEFLNYPMIDWAAEKKIFFTRSRPYKKNDQATVESKNNHLVRRYGFYYRYDTPDELAVLNRLWPLVNDRLNFFTPTKKPTGWGEDKAVRRKRIYDKPRTPFDRLIATGVLSPAQRAELTAYRDSLNPLELARRITELQGRLIELAKDKTDRMRDKLDRALPTTDTGVTIRDVS